MSDIEARVQKEREKGRTNWDSQVSFCLAAIGSAVGLGNIWRFPYLVSSYGGAPFLVPYFVILILVGMPILGMELSIGTFFQAGDADAFGSINPRLRGIGLASIFAGYTITFYYCVVLGWAVVMFGQSFQRTDAIQWVEHPSDNFWVTVSMAAATILDVDENGDSILDENGEKISIPDDSFNWMVFLALIAVWLLIFLSIFKGVKSTGWVVKFTVPVPLVIIIILIIRAAFLPGAGDGVTEYLIKWNAATLNDENIWRDSIGQVFFSLGICMGVMTAYSSHNKKTKTNVALSEKIISLSDAGIALMSGFAIYEVLGYTVFQCKEEVMIACKEEMIEMTACEKKITACEEAFTQKTFGLAFVAYPAGLATMEAPQFWGIVFFGCLIMLGIDSAFSLGECMITFLNDSWIGLRWRLKNWIVVMITCVIGLLAGLLYVFGASGIRYLDIVDNYINNWGMVLIGFLECFAIGWVYKIEDQYAVLGRVPVLVYDVGYFVSLLVGTLLGAILPHNAKDGLTGQEREDAYSSSKADSLGIGLGVFLIGWVISIVVALVLSMNKSAGLCTKLWALMGWHGPDELRRKANNSLRDTKKDGVWEPNNIDHEIQAIYRHDCFWLPFGFLIKYFSFSLLFVITILNIQKDALEPYEGYPAKDLLIGQLIFAFMLFLVLMVAIFPRIMYDPKYAGTNKSVSEQILWMLTPYTVGNLELESTKNEKTLEIEDQL